MSKTIRLAGSDNLDALLPLVAAFHAEEGIAQDDATRKSALRPLLEGSPFGAIYLIGPARAPAGYIVITFSWSVEFGGMDSLIDEFYIRPAVRERGMAREVLSSLPKVLGEAGIKALHLEVDVDNHRARRLYERAGFALRENYQIMSRKL